MKSWSEPAVNSPRPTYWHTANRVWSTSRSKTQSVGDVRGLPLEVNDKVFIEIVDFPEFDGDDAIILGRLGSNKNPAIV